MKTDTRKEQGEATNRDAHGGAGKGTLKLTSDESVEVAH